MTETQIQKLWDKPEPAHVALALAEYEAGSASVRLAFLVLLALLATIGTAKSARAFNDLVVAHGWPRRTYQRLYWELPRLATWADKYFPEWLLAAGNSTGDFIDMGNVLLTAVAEGQVSRKGLARVSGNLLGALEANVEDFEKQERGKPRTDDGFLQLRALTALLLDFAGWLPAKDVLPCLERAMTFSDDWVAAFAAISLMRLKQKVLPAIVARLAANPETRVPLYEQMHALGFGKRFPKAHATLDAFAAADVSQWLAHPSELGALPAALEKRATFTRGANVLYVWRFKKAKGPTWYAAVSGPYPADAKGPVSGTQTFSKFEPWAKRNAAGHAESVLGTLAEWAAARSPV